MNVLDSDRTGRMMMAIEQAMQNMEADPEINMSSNGLEDKLNSLFSSLLVFLAAVREREESAERGTWCNVPEAEADRLETALLQAAQAAIDAIGGPTGDQPPEGTSIRKLVRWRRGQRRNRQAA